MQTICTSLQTDNHTNTSSLNFYRLVALPDAQPSRTKIYVARTLRGSSSYRLIPVPAARARPGQQTRRLPLLMFIYGTDRLTVQPFSEPK